MNTYQAIHTLTGHKDKVMGVLFIPNKNNIVSFAWGKTGDMYFWNLNYAE